MLPIRKPFCYLKICLLVTNILSLGLKSGDRVLVQVEKSPFALALYAATIRSGCVYIPLNINYTLHELEYFFENAEPSLFVFDSKYESDISEKFKLKNIQFLTLNLDQTGSLTSLAHDQKSTFNNIFLDIHDNRIEILLIPALFASTSLLGH